MRFFEFEKLLSMHNVFQSVYRILHMSLLLEIIAFEK